MEIIKRGLLIFDLDDTLVHSRIDFPALGRWFRRELPRRGIVPQSAADWDHLSVSQLLQLAEAHDENYGTRHGPELWQKVEAAEMEGALRATVEKDARMVLEELRGRDFLLSIFTNNSSLVARTVLERFALTRFIDSVMTRDEAKVLKPDPAGLLLLKDRYQGQAPQMFYVGDHWIDGVAANRAEIPFIGFNCREPRDVKMVENVFSLPELAKLMARICP